MLTKSEFDSVVHEFIGELWAIFEGQSTKPLDPEIGELLKENLDQIQDPLLSPEERVATAFAIVNQYLESTWQECVDDGYNLYRDMRKGRASDS